MIEKVSAYVKKHRMIEEGDVIVAGVSGGADSVCLLFVLLAIKEKLPFELMVVHVNHGVREDAGADAAYVKSLCDRYKLPFYLVEADMKASAAEWGLSEEEAGRRIRYRAFREVLQREGKQGKIAVAHNSNDRAETMLFHLFRGTGLTGAGGIKPVVGDVIRPLLCAEREEIEDWLVRQGISWQTDSTNAEDAYTRNRIRHHILPYAKEAVCKSAVANMNRAADDLQAAEIFIQKEVSIAKARCVKVQALRPNIESCHEESKMGCASEALCGEKEIIIRIPELLKEDPYLQNRILLSCIEELAPGRKDITAEHIANVRRLLSGGGSRCLHLPYGILAAGEYNRLILQKNQNNHELTQMRISNDLKEYDVSIPGKMEVPGLGSVETTVFSYEKTVNIPRKTYTKWFDYDKITANACFRTRKAGDYLTINKGLEHKSLQDYFVNEKIPKKERDSFYVLADGAHIVWVPGYRISEYYKVSEATKMILQVEAIRDTKEERSHENG